MAHVRDAAISDKAAGRCRGGERWTPWMNPRTVIHFPSGPSPSLHPGLWDPIRTARIWRPSQRGRGELELVDPAASARHGLPVLRAPISTAPCRALIPVSISRSPRLRAGLPPPQESAGTDCPACRRGRVLLRRESRTRDGRVRGLRPRRRDNLVARCPAAPAPTVRRRLHKKIWCAVQWLDAAACICPEL